jgi:hypothetical protein
MSKLLILATTAGIVLASAAPGLAAQRAHRASDAYASAATADRSGSYYYGPQDAQGRATTAVPFDPAPAVQYNRGQNLPYPDRPYGNPDRW